ncbi:unnamed protein product [Medioppia subpectinata]|uniref:FBXO47 ARM repeats region domain-containing protein n=1 Tax=Medioppia subpectinata TaxID=1979941 RepID=A0A7R9KFS3_9ACAR|nr:unnamed protein product [Medioppia subpectinata]CAG2102562.1 unnamed protein product [Medioppia subpectinata]
MTCLLPTIERMDLLVKVFHRIERFPTVSINPLENQKMRLLFECYGQLIHKVIAGWDDSEVKYVFKTMQTIAHMEQRIQTIAKSPLGARQPIEYFVRCFYRYVCVDPSQKNNKNNTINESLFWLNRILKPHSLAVRAKLLLIMFGPLISVSPVHTTVPYIGWWDLTDTFFINAGLEELGFALYMLFRQTKTAEDKNSISLETTLSFIHLITTFAIILDVILLMEEMIKIPQNWLNENIASLLFFAGDDITHQYFTSKMSSENYAEVAQKLVYLTLIEHKLTRSTKLVYKLIEKLCSSEHKHKLMNELPIAFCEAVRL